MKILLGFIFLININIGFGYSKSDINLTRFEFNRYVKPQLISITQDYYTLVSILNPELKSFRKLSSTYQKLKKLQNKIEVICTQDKIDRCSIVTMELIDVLNSQRNILEEKLDFTKKEQFTADDLLHSFDQLFTLRSHHLKIQEKAQHFFFLLQLDQLNTPAIFEMKKEIVTSENLLNDFLIKCSDRRFRTEFTSFWSDFIRPVNNAILVRDDMNLFEKKLGDLNLRLHFLNVVLTKRNKPISKQAKTLLKVIHRRWNNVLKVTLRR